MDTLIIVLNIITLLLVGFTLLLVVKNGRDKKCN